MSLCDALSQYETFRKSLGERFSVNGHILAGFCRAIGPDTLLARIGPARVAEYLAGRGPLTSTYHIKYNALRGFYRYAISRGLITETPLPRTIQSNRHARRPTSIRTPKLRRLIAAADAYQKNRSVMPPLLMRTVILLQYGAALRSAEALALKLSDVNLEESVLTVRETEFFKTRLVPIGVKLTKILREFEDWRVEAGLSEDEASRFFLLKNGQPANAKTVLHAFRRIRALAEVARRPGSRWQPRLHDLRHSAAVHRVVTWYRAARMFRRCCQRSRSSLGTENFRRRRSTSARPQNCSSRPGAVSSATRRGRTAMPDGALLGSWLRRFLIEYLILERSLSKNTQRSHRDTLRLLLSFATKKTKKRVDEFTLTDMTPELLREFPPRHRRIPPLRRQHTEPTTGGTSLPCRFRGDPFTGVAALVRASTSHPFEAFAAALHHLPREGRNGRDPRIPDPIHTSRTAGPCTAAISLQLGCACRRSGPGEDRRPDDRPREGERPLVRPDPWERWQGTPLPSMGEHCGGTAATHSRPQPRGAYLSESLWQPYHALRDTHDGRAPCRACRRRRTLTFAQAGQPAHHQAHDCHASSAGRSGHQYHSRLARPRLSQHDQYLCGGRPRDEGPSACEMRGQVRETAEQVERETRRSRILACAMSVTLCGGHLHGSPSR